MRAPPNADAESAPMDLKRARMADEIKPIPEQRHQPGEVQVAKLKIAPEQLDVANL